MVTMTKTKICRVGFTAAEERSSSWYRGVLGHEAGLGLTDTSGNEKSCFRALKLAVLSGMSTVFSIDLNPGTVALITYFPGKRRRKYSPCSFVL